MLQKLLLPVALAVPFGLALNMASCGPTCPTLEPCGTTSASAGDAGSSSAGTSGSATTCAQLTALQSCLNSFCQSADNPFCTCFKRGFDLGTDCTCSDFDSAGYCQQAQENGVDAAALDCSATTGSVASLCVGVQ